MNKVTKVVKSSSSSTSSGSLSVDEDQKRILVLVIKENGEEVKKMVKDGDWDGLVALLTQKSKEQGTEVNWEKVLKPVKGKDGKKPKNGFQVIIFRRVLKDFADSEDSNSFDAESSFKHVSRKVTETTKSATKGNDLVSSIRKLAQ